MELNSQEMASESAVFKRSGNKAYKMEGVFHLFGKTNCSAGKLN